METGSLTKEQLLDMYSKMVKIREFENQAIELAKMNLTRAAVHTYNGEEAIAVGVYASLTEKDCISSTHRGHGHCIAKGADPVRMFAELMARENGYCKGKGGSMHIADQKIGILGANGIVGGGIPIATGAALAMRLQKEEGIVVCFFGDGASNEGSFHESLNFASIFKLPIVFVCENNQYGISTHVSKSTSAEHISDRAIGYHMPGRTVDGNDIKAVYKEFAEAAEYARAGKGPVLLEMETYRLSGHYYGDNENYRTREEVTSWRLKDPIKRCREYLSEEGVDQEQMDAMSRKIKEEILAASAEAERGPIPDPANLEDDLYDDSFAEIKWKPWIKQ
ncbi:MAG: thiamine pyrophosphate-dependent dehydrogenase E1 component subunit alpha [Lachnospiraceae bacterium]|nr:thiamine pyrophosphate-dependent dehydrogenase E1 component subunit alpha [Lachnospiraceae bacterium]